MKLIKIPDYTGVKYRHVATSWYILKTQDTSDLNDVYYKRVRDRNNKTSLRITQALPEFDVAYIYVVMHISNGSKIELPVKAITKSDLTVTYNYDRDVPIDVPIVTFMDNSLSTNGYLKLNLAPISPEVHDLGSVVIAIEDPRGHIVYFRDNLQQYVRILHGEIKSYRPEDEYKLYIWMRNQDFLLSPPKVMVLASDVTNIRYLSHIRDVDSSRPYKVRFDKDVKIESVDLYRGSKLIKTYNSDTIFGDDILMDGKSYTLSIKLYVDGKRLLYTVTIYSLYSGGLYDRDPTNIFRDLITAESMAIAPLNDYTEKTKYGRIIMFTGDRIISVKSYSLIVKDIGESGIYCDPDKPVYVREISELEVSVVHTDHGVKKVSILLLNRTGLAERVLYSAKLPAGSAYLPAVVKNTENRNPYQIFTAISIDGEVKVKDLITGVIYGKLQDVHKVSSLSFTYLGGEEIIIVGNMTGIYRFDYNLRVVDNITYMPRDHQVQEHIPSRLATGSLILFFKNANNVLEIKPDTGEHVNHKFRYEIKKITRYRDGSFTILTKDSPEPPSLTDIFRYE